MSDNDQTELDGSSPSETKIDWSAAITRAVNAMDKYHYAKDFGTSDAVLSVLRAEVEQALDALNIARSNKEQDSYALE